MHLVIAHGLKSADALHLATAKEIADFTESNVIFVSSDNELLKAAKAEKLGIQNPEE